MKVHVIMLNNTPVYVVVGDEVSAVSKKDELSDRYFAANKHAYLNREDYDARCFWYIMTVDSDV